MGKDYLAEKEYLAEKYVESFENYNNFRNQLVDILALNSLGVCVLDKLLDLHEAYMVTDYKIRALGYTTDDMFKTAFPKFRKAGDVA